MTRKALSGFGFGSRKSSPHLGNPTNFAAKPGISRQIPCTGWRIFANTEGFSLMKQPQYIVKNGGIYRVLPQGEGVFGKFTHLARVMLPQSNSKEKLAAIEHNFGSADGWLGHAAPFGGRGRKPSSAGHKFRGIKGSFGSSSVGKTMAKS